eukprot:g1667.t1
MSLANTTFARNSASNGGKDIYVKAGEDIWSGQLLLGCPAESFTDNDNVFASVVLQSGSQVYKDTCAPAFGTPSSDDKKAVSVSSSAEILPFNCPSSCAPCTKGRYSSLSSLISVGSSCTDCEMGKYQPASGQTSCTLCAGGKYSDQTGQSSNSACKNCPIPKYQDLTGTSKCKDCPNDSGTTEQGATTIQKCLKACKSAACKPGTYGTATTAEKPPTCSDCASGRYNSAQGLTNASDCSECPLGRWRGAKGATSLDQCIKCEAGKFGNTSGASEASKCYACKRGIEYTDDPGQPACKSASFKGQNVTCDSDYYKTNDLCERCRAGQKSSDDRTHCVTSPTTVISVIVSLLVVLGSAALIIPRHLRYRRKYAVVKLGKRRCCHHRWRLDFPRQSRFSRLDVAEGAKLGNGAFGEVNQGTLQVGKATLRIAVKHVLESKATDAQRRDTIVECRLQCELESPFLVKCFGFTTGPGPGDFSILLELMDIGDLPRYMESVVGSGGRIPEATRLRWMIEIASALEYMHASNLIHADLAARNLVLYHSKTGIGCKVTDFGLSHSIDPNTKTYMLPYGGSVPFHWTAPECLPCNANFLDIYSSSSGGGGGDSGGGAGSSAADRVLRLTPANDVWAFGITVWEIEGLAANGVLVKPFNDVPNKDLYDSLSTKKAKLEFKFTCNDKTIDTFKDPAEVVMKSCLRVRPWARCSMTDIRRRLQAATLCDAVDWEQDDVHKWLGRMGAPRVEGADLWDLDDYEMLLSELLNDDNRPDYVAELKEDMDDDDLFALSGRLRGELAGLVDLVAFLDGETCPTGDMHGHPEQFTWLAKRDNQPRLLYMDIR